MRTVPPLCGDLIRNRGPPPQRAMLGLQWNSIADHTAQRAYSGGQVAAGEAGLLQP